MHVRNDLIDRMMTSLVIPQTTTHWPAGGLQQWEEAGIRLESAVVAFLQSCMALEQAAMVHPLCIDNLPFRLDRRIEHFHTLLTQSLAQSLASVTRTRNKLVTSIYRLPPEILGNIFELAISSTENDLPMESAIIESCLCLYRILGVCSAWRKVGIAHAPLWTLVPVISHTIPAVAPTEKSASLSLERAGGVGLRLVADVDSLGQLGPSFREKLVEDGARFRSVSLRSGYDGGLEGALDSLLDTIIPGSIAELSLAFESLDIREGLHEDSGPFYLFNYFSPHRRATFAQVLGSVRILRLKNIVPHMDSVSLGNLLELRIHGVAFGPDNILTDFLLALSTAPQLQTLDIISVTTCQMADLPASADSAPLSLPSLQTLFLENLLCNVLHTVLHSIKPGEQRVVLSLTHNALSTLSSIGYVGEGDFDAFITAIRPHPIDTLVLNIMNPFGGSNRLRPLLSIMPSLTTIYFDHMSLDCEALVELTRISNPTHSQINIPQLRRVYISRTTIYSIKDQTPLKNMLSSHPLEELVLGGRFTGVLDITLLGTAPDACVDIACPDMITIKTWLQENIPKFKLLGCNEPFKFKPDEWPIW
ncbi:unnamed protein product [Rhizoctonia solani]|uniref:F-box domain-containing protein n=1 Tax=Rhizoctonia solani TaxID=456999 RepID=A0A8H2XYI5_9AGAM|nr:unnamed protein product [Rhizoctonia solani]